MKRQTTILILLGLIFAAGCGDSKDDEPAEHHTGDPHWEYDGDAGPEHWGELEGYAKCATGREQSPIDITGVEPGAVDMEFVYGTSPLNIVNNGHTVQVNYKTGSTLTYDGETYELKQFHFHAGSEHTTDGNRHPMEMHLVHANAAGKIAVIGVLIDSGTQNDALAGIFSNLPQEEGPEKVIAGVTVDIHAALPSNLASWRYAGSRTTPPCDEGFSWIVLSTPIQVSPAQIDAFTKVHNHNFRPTQELFDREIEGKTHEPEVHWSYDGEGGPENWGDLEPEYAACGDGTEQSPIDITGVTPGDDPELGADYGPSAINILNNGHTVQVNYDPGSVLSYKDEVYELKQFHFHAGSEHTVDGVQHPMEMHMVHATAEGKLAVLGVFIEEGDENAALADVFANLPAEEGDPVTVDGAEVFILAALPEVSTSWRYDGSLTTPPCTEGVSWIVLSTPIEASADQIGAFTSLFDHNYRPSQPLGEREIAGEVEEPEVHWSYDGEGGPENWGDLEPEYAACGEGTEQSPIDIAGVTPGDDPDLAAEYAPSALNIVNNGHTVQVNYDPGNMLFYGGQTYELKQFHFHAGSEHTVDGERHPLELHVVHATEEGNLAVLGIFIDEGAENDALAEVFENLPAEEGEPFTVDGATIDIVGALPTVSGSWRYDGSLTTPPCTEGVRWILLATPIEASALQIGAFTSIFDHNYRPAQPLNARAIAGE